MKKINEELWEKCVAFHGHECPGLTIGYRAALYAMDLLGLTFSYDEEVVCISENDACGVDAIQVILGCTVGKSNLLFHMTGKQAFSFYVRNSGRSVRLLLKKKQGLDHQQLFEYYHICSNEDMFEIKPATIAVPEHAKIFKSFICDGCGESTGSNWIRLSGDKKLCPDCYESYDRFNV